MLAISGKTRGHNELCTYVLWREVCLVPFPQTTLETSAHCRPWRPGSGWSLTLLSPVPKAPLMQAVRTGYFDSPLPPWMAVTQSGPFLATLQFLQSSWVASSSLPH